MCDSTPLSSFLIQIGRNSASHIRHIRIDFSRIRSLGRHYVTLEDNGIRILAKIQSFRAIPSLPKIISRVDQERLNVDFKKTAENHGRTIKVMEQREESGSQWYVRTGISKKQRGDWFSD